METYVERYLYFKSHLFGGEGCAAYLFNIQVGGTLRLKIFVFKSYLFGGEGHATYLSNIQLGGNLR